MKLNRRHWFLPLVPAFAACVLLASVAGTLWFLWSRSKDILVDWADDTRRWWEE